MKQYFEAMREIIILLPMIDPSEHENEPGGEENFAEKRSHILDYQLTYFQRDYNTKGDLMNLSTQWDESRTIARPDLFFFFFYLDYQITITKEAFVSEHLEYVPLRAFKVPALREVAFTSFANPQSSPCRAMAFRTGSTIRLRTSPSSKQTRRLRVVISNLKG